MHTNAISEESTIFRFPGYPSFSVGEGSRNLNGSGLLFNGSGPDFNGSSLIFNGSITVPLPQCLNHFDLNHGDTFVPAVKTNSRISATTIYNNKPLSPTGSSALAQKHVVFYLSCQMCICGVRIPMSCNNHRASLGVSMVESQQTIGFK